MESPPTDTKPVDLVTNFRFASRILWKFLKKYEAFLNFMFPCILHKNVHEVHEQKIREMFSENPQFFLFEFLNQI